MISCHRESGNLFITTTPVFKVSTANPTADKPQSKLWFQNDCWWAILPSSTGPSLWQRTSKGWILHKETEEALTGVPGRSDVWPENNSVTAVGVADHFLTVYQLKAIKSQQKVFWKSKILVNLFPPDSTAFIETATIARDKSGVLFVAAVIDAKVFVWISSGSDEKWSVFPLTLSEGLDKDDICVITPVQEGIGVIWSDQNREGFFMRKHITGKPAEIWETEDVIEKGRRTADDHLNACLANNNTLWLATKNSVDSVGRPSVGA